MKVKYVYKNGKLVDAADCISLLIELFDAIKVKGVHADNLKEMLDKYEVREVE